MTFKYILNLVITIIILCANNIRKWLLNNNLIINSSKTMLLNIYHSNFVFPDIIDDNIFKMIIFLKLNSLKYLFHVIYRSQIMNQVLYICK